MTVPQQQFTESTRRGQEALAVAVQTWTENVSSFLGALPTQPGELPNAQKLVEHFFDFAEQQLVSQRELAKNLLSAATPAAEAMQDETPTNGTRKTTTK